MRTMASSARSIRDGLTRAFKTLFVMATVLGSLLVPPTPVVAAIVDLGSPPAILQAIPGSFLQQGLKSYDFRSSLVDIFMLSAVRSLAIICAYAFSGARYTGYLLAALLMGLVTVLFVALKIFFYHPSEGPPANTWGVPLLLLSSVVCALGHAVLAYRTSCQAKRKLFLQKDEEHSFLCKYSNRFRSKRRKALCNFAKGDKDEGYTTRNLADSDSQFMLCKGLHLHYKMFEGSCHSVDKENCNPNRRQLARSGSMSLPSTRVLREPTKEALGDSLRTSMNRQNSADFVRELNKGRRDASQHVVDIETLRLPRQTKESARRAVVLIHGFGGGVFSWRHIMDPLARQSGYTVASFDRPGWGLTSRPDKNDTKENVPDPYDLHSQVDLLIGFCQKLGFKSVVLVGHDDGGLLALMTAAKASHHSKAPVKVIGVVLIGVSLSREIVPAFARVLLHTSLGRHLLRPVLCSEMAGRHAWHDASKLTSEVMDLYRVPLHMEGWDRALTEAKRSSSSNSLQSHVPQELLRSVKDLPALLVAGMQDMLVPLQAVELLASQLTRSKLVAIPRCGHLPPEECPGSLLAALVPFISELFGSVRGERSSLPGIYS